MILTFSQAALRDLDVYWRAANFLSVGQIFLWDNPLLIPEPVQPKELP